MTTQPPIYVAAYAAGVLMFFAPCSVGLLPAYFAYYLTQDGESGRPVQQSSPVVAGLRLGTLVIGLLLFLAGAVPLFYVAAAGIQILLPGYDVIVPLGRLGRASYLPSVGFVLAGTLSLVVGVGGRTTQSGLRIGGVATLGILATYLAIGLPIVVLGRWLEPYLTSLELLVGPLLVVLGLLYYRGVSPLRAVKLPDRGEASHRAFFLFGVVYGVGSLACNVPVFLGVVISVFGTRGMAEGMAVFAAFAAGMGTLMVGTSILAAGSRTPLSPGKHTRVVRLAGSAAFVALGAYVTWFSFRSFGLL